VHYDWLANINSADVLIPNWTRIVFWQGETCVIPVMLSHFSAANLENARVEWSLDKFPRVRGAFENLNPRAADSTALGEMTFRVPDLDASVHVELEMKLFDAKGALVTQNTQTLYFFPHETRTASHKIAASPDWQEPLRALGYELVALNAADVVVVSKLTDELRTYVQSGGRVLWVAQDPDAQHTLLGSVEVQPRQGRKWQGDWASNLNWIHQQKLFPEIPTDNLIDFAFADLTPEYVITGFHPRDFGADVYAGLFIGWIHHPVALIGRRRVGDGELWICTLRLREHITENFKHPVATILMRNMLEKIAARRAVSPEVGSAL
jgi:hypothetical protein